MTNAEIYAWQNRVQSPIEKALRRAFSLGQTYWQQADSESYSQNRKSDDTRAKFEELVASMQAEATPSAQPAAASTPEPAAQVVDVYPSPDGPQINWLGALAKKPPKAGTLLYLSAPKETK